MDMFNGLLIIIAYASLVNSEASRNFDQSVQHLLELYSSNQHLLDGINQPLSVVYPQQIRRNELVGISTKEHRIRHHGTHEHYKHVTFQIEIDDVRYKLKLELNEALLSSGITVKHYINRNQQVLSKTVEHCYYHGTVKRDDWSAVAVSTCNGIRGIIHLHNQTYIIQPLLGGDEGMRHPHVLYKASVSDKETCGNAKGQWLPFRELHKGEYVRRLKYLKAQRLSRDVVNDPTYVQLALIFDTSVFKSLNLSHAAMVIHAIQTANIVDLYYKVLNVRIALVYAELWNVVDQFKVSSVLRETLENFLKFKTRTMRNVQHNVAHFVTSGEFEDYSVGIAIPDSICTERAVGINRNPDSIEPQQLATILAHTIGHNLGMKHDEDGDCECLDVYGCIMSTRVLSFRGFHSRMFSSCSLRDLEITMQMGLGSCLANANELNFPQHCGNGYVERGEECDCGSREDCKSFDPCCDPDTCLLRYWASCRTGPCCNNCTLYPTSHICRDRSTECDVPEYCDGLNGECPTNDFIQDGHPCSNSTGYCVGGICPTLQQQCEAIWGEGSSSGDFQCYDKFNPTGNFNGHCGRDEATGHYVKCTPENAQCGLLHCSGGLNVPLHGPDKAFSKTTVFSHGVKYECKIVHGPAALDMPHMGMVQDGTRCGDGSLCMNEKCVTVKNLPRLHCPANSLHIPCSDKGVCTQAGVCFCEPGWGGFSCDKVVEIITEPPTTRHPTTQYLTTGAPGNLRTLTTAPPTSHFMNSQGTTPAQAVIKASEKSGLSTTWLVIILASVVGGLVLIIGLMMVCYRRKSPNKSTLGSKSNIFCGADSALLKKKLENASKDGNLGKKSLRLGKDKKKGKKNRISTDEESDIGELPPPPIIITSPNSAKPPEKGILKNSLRFKDTLVQTSEDNTDDNNDENCADDFDQGSRSSLSLTQCMGNDEELEEDEADAELRQILEGSTACNYRDHDHNYAGLNMINSDSYDNHFVLPAPPSTMFDSPLPSPAFSFASSGRSGNYAYPARRGSNNSGQGENSISSSPALARHLRLRPLGELVDRNQPTYVDLSPSPEDMISNNHKISPSNSEDIRSSETEVDRDYYQCAKNSETPKYSKIGIREDRRPSLPRREPQHETSDAAGLGLAQIPKLSPLRFDKFLLHGRTNYDGNGAMIGEPGSHHGTGNSRSGCEKSSGYGSEQDPDRKSLEDIINARSRSQSSSPPPSFSNVIRTGPNRIQLVPGPAIEHHAPPPPLPPLRHPQKITYSANERLQKLLEGLPRISAGSFERSPVQNINTPSGSTSGSSSSSGSNRGSFVSTPSEPVPKPRSSLGGRKSNRDSAPCIDRSLDEIPQTVQEEKGWNSVEEEGAGSAEKTRRPTSLDVFQKSSLTDTNNLNTASSSGDKLEKFANKQYGRFDRGIDRPSVNVE